MNKKKDYLEDLLSRLMTEVRPYCRPSLVDYDVFPVFKEATEYIRNKTMTLDELLETVPVEVKNAIEEICERAGTYDADWEVLKAAGELLVKYK